MIFLKKIVGQILGMVGYELRQKRQKEPLFVLKLDAYLNDKGGFSFSHYKKIQEEGNKKKIETVWVKEENIKYLSNYIVDNINPKPKKGICHGTRQGKEQEWFNKYLNCYVIGTEISETASQFPNTIQWDFHKIKPEWNEAFDFVYSNSYDHSYDPKKCILNWIKSLKPGGVCIIEHSDVDETTYVSELDPFGVSVAVIPYLFLRWGEGQFFVSEIIPAPEKDPALKYLDFLVLKKQIVNK